MEEKGGGVLMSSSPAALGGASYPELFSTDSGLCCIHLSAFIPPSHSSPHALASSSGMKSSERSLGLTPPRACSRLLTKTHDPFIGFVERQGGAWRTGGREKGKELIEKLLFLEGNSYNYL